MKNKSIFLGLIGIVLICIIATGCIFYNVLDPEDFKKHFEDLGYTISDKETGKYEANTYLVAKKDDSSFDILYYEFDTEVDAKKAYQDYKENIGNYITSNSKNKETSGAVLTKIVAVSDKEYIVISRVKKTLIFIAGTNDVSGEIDNILEEIKY